jgi:hypothetical protein
MPRKGPSLVKKAPKVGPRSGHVKALFAITPEQHETLKAEAMRRAQARGTLRPDASELVREALDAWIAKRRDRA